MLICGICGKKGNNTLIMHITKFHKMPIKEYKEKFPNNPYITNELKNKISKTHLQKYVDGYESPTKGLKRPDLVEWNKINIPILMKGHPVTEENLRKRKKTIQGREKEIYGRSGPDNPNWRGGTSFGDYSFEFNKELKLAIKIRDKYQCKICKKPESETPQGLHIHHIDYNKHNNNTENLVSLCECCHTKTNGRRQRWIEYFSRSFNINKKIISWEDLDNYCEQICEFLKDKTITGIVPIPRGGVVPAVTISHKLGIPIKIQVEHPTDIIIDEIIDFGTTFKRFKKLYPNNLFICIHINKNNYLKKDGLPDFFCEYVTEYIIYPWESPSTNLLPPFKAPK